MMRARIHESNIPFSTHSSSKRTKRCGPQGHQRQPISARSRQFSSLKKRKKEKKKKRKNQMEKKMGGKEAGEEK